RFEQISIEDGRMIVRCSPVSHIVFYSNLVWTSDRCLSGSGLTQGECELRDNQGARFLRCQLIDAEGRSAWSSPIML
ncbi:MAG: hypothetical protein PHY12_01570, partial [Eubacteriales bacterium]|nr:hypothetical protein [Eubacteriales bacterium]